MRRLWLPLVILLAGCVYGPIGGLRGSGDMTSETREVSGFDEVVLEGSGQVTIAVTGEESLTIEAEDNIIGHLTSDVTDGRLVLGTDQSVSPTRAIVYTITAATLDGVTISGSGDVEAGDIDVEQLTTTINGSGTIELNSLQLTRLVAEISGSGSIEVSGTANAVELSIPGSGTFRGEDLAADTGTVDISGSGAAVVNVTDSLDVTVSGSGSVEYLGSPSVQSSITGSGSVTER